MWDVEAANNSQIEDDHFISTVKINVSGIWISAFAEMTVNLVSWLLGSWLMVLWFLAAPISHILHPGCFNAPFVILRVLRGNNCSLAAGC